VVAIGVHASVGPNIVAGTTPTDWRTVLIECIREPGMTKDRKIRGQALRYVVIDNILYRRTIDGLLLKCLSQDEANVAMGEVHEGMCGTHQSAHKMSWALQREGMYWPNMLKIASDIIEDVSYVRSSEKYS
jgi:hypothetical protein